MAADDDDNMEWLDIEKIQYPLSDEEFDENAAEYEFSDVEVGFDLTFRESWSCSRWGGCSPTSS